MDNLWVILLAGTGLIMLCAGIKTNIYPVKSAVFKKRKRTSARNLAESRAFGLITDWIIGDETGYAYKIGKNLLNKSETSMEVKTLYFYKLTCALAAAAVLILIRHTNVEILKASIIAKSAYSSNVFEEAKTENYKYNFELYKKALSRIGERNMKGLDEKRKIDAVKKALGEQVEYKGQDLEYRAKGIVKAFNSINGISVVDIKTIAFIFIAFFIPEIVLLLRRLLLNNQYRKEVIKLESIFELLGSIKGFKTVYILDEMSKASNTCGKKLKQCLGTFYTDREKALEELKYQVNNRKFSRLVDVIRIYSLVDKKTAMEILERNRLEKEEEMLLTVEEDIDIVDVVAFISVTPIIFELGNLMMKPMLDMIFQAFSII